MPLKKWQLITLFLFICVFSNAQTISTLREKQLLIISDTVVLDSMMIFPHTVQIYSGDSLVAPRSYSIDAQRGLLLPSEQLINQKLTLRVRYRVCPYPFQKPFYHKNISQILHTPYISHITNGKANSFASGASLGEIRKQGSLSRGLSFGNSQNVVVNSNLNLQLSGYLNNHVQIMAALSDNNIPLQPDGNTQQIQDFDRIFIKLFTQKQEVILGDYLLKSPKGSYMKFFRKVQGGKYKGRYNLQKGVKLSTTLSGSISKGKYHRMHILGIEGNQGPYRLVGKNNESWIIVLSGTERVYLEGKLLSRGQQNDYIINYNTAELEFTPHCPITRNSRIDIEFEYSEQNYARFLLFSSTEFKGKNTHFWINLFSDQDSRNQPLDQSLNKDQKTLLSTVGDNLERARVQRIQKISFDSEKILYKKILRTIDNKTYQVYQYSTHPDSARYQLSFSFVGDKKGNYQLATSTANGRVFQWTPPRDGVSQGNYQPVVQLIAPEKQHMITLGGEYRSDSSNYARLEVALSSLDLNTFSSMDDDNNRGLALNTDIKKHFSLRDTLWGVTTGAAYQFRHRYYNEIETTRIIEFNRNWNLPQQIQPENEHLIDFSTALSHSAYGNVGYHMGILNRGDNYQGVRHGINTTIHRGGFRLLFHGNLLNTSQSALRTQFLKHDMEIAQQLPLFTLGLHTKNERNIWEQKSDGAIQGNSFAFQAYEIFVESSPNRQNKFTINYKFRKDELPYLLKLRSQSRSQDLGITLDLLKNSNNKLKTTAIYRQLHLINENIIDEKPENTLLGRVEHLLRLGKGMFHSNIFYEIGSGLEAIKEFSYIEVPPGQGLYRWIDYNNNEIRELNEFEIATFQDEAKFIRIITPSNSYRRVYSNEFRQILQIRLQKISQRHWTGRFLSRFSNRFSYRINKKSDLKEFQSYGNPFEVSLSNSHIISLNSNIQNTFSYKKKESRTAWDYLHIESQSKQLMASGFDMTNMTENGLRFRWSFASAHQLINRIDRGKKRFNSEYFKQKDYNIHYLKENIHLQMQPTTHFQWGLEYQYQNKKNRWGNQRAINHRLSSEIKYSFLRKGSIQLKAQYLSIHYKKPSTTPIAYQMLEGFQPGNNLTWAISYDQKISKIFNLRLNYNGRHSQKNPAIHNGSMELRAQF